MKSALCLILDEEAKVYLTLKVADSYKLDKYTMGFKTASDLREEYKEVIKEFLEQNKETLKHMQYQLDNFNFNGWIVVLQQTNEGVIIKKALFGKHRKEFKALCHDKKFMRQLLLLDEEINKDGKHYISEFLTELIENEGTFDSETELKKIKNEIDKKDNKTFFELLRLMIKLRKILEKEENIAKLDKNEITYKELIDQYNEMKLLIKRVDTYAKTQEQYYVNGVRYSQEEQELFDLDDLKSMDDAEFLPDGLGKNEKKLR